MVDCLTLCNTGCLTCIWLLLLSLCFPKYSNHCDDSGSDICTFKPRPKTQHCKKFRRRSSSCEFEKRNIIVLKPVKCKNNKRKCDSFDQLCGKSRNSCRRKNDCCN